MSPTRKAKAMYGYANAKRAPRASERTIGPIGMPIAMNAAAAAIIENTPPESLNGFRNLRHRKDADIGSVSQMDILYQEMPPDSPYLRH